MQDSRKMMMMMTSDTGNRDEAPPLANPQPPSLAQKQPKHSPLTGRLTQHTRSHHAYIQAATTANASRLCMVACHGSRWMQDIQQRMMMMLSETDNLYKAPPLVNPQPHNTPAPTTHTSQQPLLRIQADYAWLHVTGLDGCRTAHR
jgi:hypothetical protein